MGILVPLFIDPGFRPIRMLLFYKTRFIEFHTGPFGDTQDKDVASIGYIEF